MDFLADHQTTLTNLVTAAAILALTWFAVVVTRRAVDRFVNRRSLAREDPAAHTRYRMLQQLATATLVAVGVGLALYLLDIDALQRVAVGVFASVGLLGIVLGLAAQSTVANLIAGIVLAFVQPLRLGDRVNVAGESGVVEEIGLFYTQIRAWDNRLLLIPNKLLSNEVIKNYSMHDPVMPAIAVFRVSEVEQVPRAREILLGVAQQHELVVTPPDPRVDLVEADDKGRLLRLVAWGGGADQAWRLATELGEAGLARLADAGIATAAYRLETEGPFREDRDTARV